LRSKNTNDNPSKKDAEKKKIIEMKKTTEAKKTSDTSLKKVPEKNNARSSVKRNPEISQRPD
jgi:hypothetical protein